MAAWQWETKQRLLARGGLDGDFVVFGSSVLFHGLDPTPANKLLGDEGRVVNLALNGQQLQHSAQLLDRYLATDHRPIRLVILEIWRLDVTKESWTGGPYYKFWASWSEFAQSKAQYWEPSVLVPFAANRLLTSFRYREGLDNWISTSLRSRRIDSAVLSRNVALTDEMEDFLGRVRADFEDRTLTAARVPAAQLRPWIVDSTADIWLHRFLETCARARVPVVLLVPPTPPYIEKDRSQSGYYDGLQRYADELRREFPPLDLKVVTFPGYELSDFADDHHLSSKGVGRFSNRFAQWLEGQRDRR